MLPLHDDQPTKEMPVITILLMAICIAVFVWQVTLGDNQVRDLFYGLGVVPALLLGPLQLPPEKYIVHPIITLFSSMFLHSGWLHVLGNMLYLWIFGNNVEDAMGHRSFLLFYFTCGAIAGLTQCITTPDSTIPMVGASGAVAGTLGAYLLLHPKARILTFIFLGIFWTFIRLPAVVVLGGWIAIQTLNGMWATGPGSGVAWMAHVGGFAAGFFLVGVFKRRSSPFFWQARARR